jgi:hypothetical protein
MANIPGIGINPFNKEDEKKDIEFFEDIENKIEIINDEFGDYNFLTFVKESFSEKEQSLDKDEFIKRLKVTPLGIDFNYIIFGRSIYNEDIKPIYTCPEQKCVKEIPATKEVEKEDKETGEKKTVTIRYKKKFVENDKLIEHFLESDEFNTSAILDLL